VNSEPTPPQLTFRAIATGFVIGAILTPCNIYSGLKIGWSFNMSIAAALLSYGLWNGLHHFGIGRRWGLLENNINQTSASSAASIISAGLVAPIPALTILTGKEFTYGILAVWVFTVSFTGIIIALGLRRQMLVEEKLPFPNGVATAETIREMYGEGRDAVIRLTYLASAALISALWKGIGAFIYPITSLGLPSTWGLSTSNAVAASGLTSLSFRNLGFVLDPSLLMIGFGAIVGMRVGISLLFGGFLAWMVLGPMAINLEWIYPPDPSDPNASWFSAMLEWLLWPGITIMLLSSLTSFAFSLKRIAKGWLEQIKASSEGRTAKNLDPEELPGGRLHIPWKWFWIGLAIALVASTIAQNAIFNIPVWLGILAVLLTFVLAVVAARVSGETGIPPIGALGKITQLTFGALSPANTTVNLMAANVTGGAAGQCSDLLHDLKTGMLVGARLKLQAIAQVFGILSGALAGTAAYFILIPNPAEMLLTPEWPAPAVATWKAVAEVLAEGFHTIPTGCVPAMVIAGIVGIALACCEKLVPEKSRHWVPSGPSIGLAFVIPASISISLFLGALLAMIIGLFAPNWRKKYIIVIAAGLVAGESLMGVLESLISLLT
tara:strand:- start:5650 stop:7473 length:1824 start_codon:yes stop_codon:yes gene_type:complete